MSLHDVPSDNINLLVLGETEMLTVPDEYQLEPPEDCVVLIDERKSTEWASWHVIKYRFGSDAFARAPRAKRRRVRRD